MAGQPGSRWPCLPTGRRGCGRGRAAAPGRKCPSHGACRAGHGHGPRPPAVWREAPPSGREHGGTCTPGRGSWPPWPPGLICWGWGEEGTGSTARSPRLPTTLSRIHRRGARSPLLAPGWPCCPRLPTFLSLHPSPPPASVTLAAHRPLVNRLNELHPYGQAEDRRPWPWFVGPSGH